MTENSTSNSVPVILTIAGSDPSGGAGIQGDLKTIQALGGWGQAVICGLTAQSTLGVAGAQGVDPQFVQQQLEALWADIPPAAAKTGMLATREIVLTVAQFMRDHPLPLVVDPVMVSTSGARLLSEDATESIRRDLIPRSTLLTPNAPEAEVLCSRSLRTLVDIQDAIQQLLSFGAQAVLIKGGDASLGGTDCVVDVYGDQQGNLDVLESPRLSAGPHSSFHGSGCCLAAAAATALGIGWSPREAALAGRLAVKQAISGAWATGKGAIPVNHRGILPIPQKKAGPEKIL